MEALSSEFCIGLPCELFYTDDLCLLVETEENSVVKIKHWKGGRELEGHMMNLGKMKVMCCKAGS
jgi:hypothetical protein